jgi:hypothetical protein
MLPNETLQYTGDEALSVLSIYRNVHMEMSKEKLILYTVELQLSGRWLSGTPIIRTLVIRNSNYPDRLGPSSKFVENSTKLTCFEIAGYLIKYSTVLLILELQIRRGQKF